jgi:hypothetical protein
MWMKEKCEKIIEFLARKEVEMVALAAREESSGSEDKDKGSDYDENDGISAWHPLLPRSSTFSVQKVFPTRR